MRNKKKIYLILIVFILGIFALTVVGCAENLGEEVGEATITIECKTILDNMDKVEEGLIDNNLIPKDGIILPKTTVVVYEKDTVYTLLKRVCKKNKIHIDSSYEPIFKTNYIKGINYIYEMSVGESSGWMYFVDGVEANHGVSLYKLKGGENIRVAYTVVAGDLN